MPRRSASEKDVIFIKDHYFSLNVSLLSFNLNPSRAWLGLLLNVVYFRKHLLTEDIRGHGCFK
jgi:hypothetical protein